MQFDEFIDYDEPRGSDIQTLRGTSPSADIGTHVDARPKPLIPTAARIRQSCRSEIPQLLAASAIVSLPAFTRPITSHRFQLPLAHQDHPLFCQRGVTFSVTA
jgi:hypothetical protein